MKRAAGEPNAVARNQTKKKGAVLLLRRVMGHVRAQNWAAVGIDFVIVVVGVFVGLQAQQWAETRADRRIEGEYLLARNPELLRED